MDQRLDRRRLQALALDKEMGCVRRCVALVGGDSIMTSQRFIRRDICFKVTYAYRYLTVSIPPTVPLRVP